MCSKLCVVLLENSFPIQYIHVCIYIDIIMNSYTQLSLCDVLGAGHCRKRKLEEMDDCTIEPQAKIHHP